jgi:hypothetical protein
MVDEEEFAAMIEVPGWFLMAVGVAIWAAAHRRRRGTAFLHDGDIESL